MKIRRAILFLLATIMLFTCSCQKKPGDRPIVESEPQYMAYRLGEAMKLGEDIYFNQMTGESVAPILATEYGTENFEVYTPCFDPTCDHRNRTKCCLKVYGMPESFCVFPYNGELAMVLYEEANTCFSIPYSNFKIDLLCEDFVFIEDEKERQQAQREWQRSDAYPLRSEQLVYKDYYYYVELKGGVRTQYRISLEGGEPERVFEEDNIIIRTIINDRFYGIRYENVDPDDPWGILTGGNSISYFRSDMNYENVEALPDKLSNFRLVNDNLELRPEGHAILDADEEFLYVMYDNKIWKIPDSDINAEPTMLSDFEDKLPLKDSFRRTWYNDGVLYVIRHGEQYERELYNVVGILNPKAKWFGTTTLYIFNIRTGECVTHDLSSETYSASQILYADSDYLYVSGSYVHDDSREISGLIMRITLETMRYEFTIPSYFWDYSVQKEAE